MAVKSNLITVTYAYVLTDVACIHAAFDAADLPVIIGDETMCRVHPQTTLALGGMRVQVWCGDVAGGQDLLAPMAKDRPPARFRPFVSAFWLAGFALHILPCHLGPGLYLYRPVRPQIPQTRD